MEKQPYITEIEVRDYECDMQGIVNNAVYQNYLEHARHSFIKSKGLDFGEITRGGIHLVVMRAEIDYKAPLKNGMTALVETYCTQISKFKTEFTQVIKIKELDGKLAINARFIIASINERGRPERHPETDKLFD